MTGADDLLTGEFEKPAQEIVHDIYAVLNRICDAQSFNGFSYRFFDSRGSNLNVNFLISSYPPPLRDLIDKTRENSLVRYCLTNLAPIFWSTKAIDYMCKDGRAVIDALLGHDVFGGMTMPFHSTTGEVGIISFGLRRGSILDESDKRVVLSRHYVEAIEIFEASRKIARNVSDRDGLSRRQRECLYWCSRGKTSWEISKILGIRKQTVDFHLRGACERCGAVNRTQAVVLSSQAVRWESFLQSDFELISI